MSHQERWEWVPGFCLRHCGGKLDYIKAKPPLAVMLPTDKYAHSTFCCTHNYMIIPRNVSQRLGLNRLHHDDVPECARRLSLLRSEGSLPRTLIIRIMWSWTNHSDFLCGGRFCLDLTLGSGRSEGFIVTFPQACVSLRALLPFFFLVQFCWGRFKIYSLRVWPTPPFPGAGVQGMFARKPNPTLMLIQGQRNSCNLSLYLLGSLSPSHTLGISSADCCLSHQCLAPLLRVTDARNRRGKQQTPQCDLAAVAMEGRVITFHHRWKGP